MRFLDGIEMTTTAIASGTGAVTMTAITAEPDFTLGLGSTNTDCPYVIWDTVNGYFERGRGRVAANVLTRTKPQTVYNGTTLNCDSPSAFNFGATPTSGQIKIRLTADPAMMGINLGQIQTSISGDTWRDFPISAHLQQTATGSPKTLVANTEYYSCYKTERAGVLKGVQSEVTTGLSGNLKLCLYGLNYDGLPGAKIVDFVTQTTTSAAVKTDTAPASWSVTTPIYLPAGWYYIGFISDVASTLRANAGVGGLLTMPTPLGRRNQYGYGNMIKNAGSYTTGMPATYAVGSSAIVDNGAEISTMWMGLKQAA